MNLDTKNVQNLKYKEVIVSPNSDISTFGAKLQKIGLFNYESNKDES